MTRFASDMIRIHHFLAQAGIASRRHSEQLILEGRVTLKGNPITHLGTKITWNQYADIRVDGEKLPPLGGMLYILLNKPDGFISSTADPQGRPTVLGLLPGGFPRLYPVGRLDFHSEGLLLLTNDGLLTHTLLHPRFHVPKVYEAKVKGIPDPAALKSLCGGVQSRGERLMAHRAEITRRGERNAWLLIEIHQGKNHQIRRMCDQIGYPLLKLKRLSFGPIKLGSLSSGQWRWLEAREIELLRKYSALGKEGKPKNDSSDD